MPERWETVKVDSLHPDIGDEVSVRYVGRGEIDERFDKSSTDPGIFSYITQRYGDPRLAELESGSLAFEKTLKEPLYSDETPFFEAGMYKALSLRDLAPEPLYICHREDAEYLGTEFLTEFGDPSEVEITDEEQFSWETGYLAGYFEKNEVLHGDLERGSSSTNSLTNGENLLAIDFTETGFTDSEQDLKGQTIRLHDLHSQFISDDRYAKWFENGYEEAKEEPGLEEEVRGYLAGFEGLDHQTNPSA